LRERYAAKLLGLMHTAHHAPQRCPNTDPRCAENLFKVPKNEGFCFESASTKNGWKVLPVVDVKKSYKNVEMGTMLLAKKTLSNP